jgi:hypothetical protein
LPFGPIAIAIGRFRGVQLGDHGKSFLLVVSKQSIGWQTSSPMKCCEDHKAVW